MTTAAPARRPRLRRLTPPGDSRRPLPTVDLLLDLWLTEGRRSWKPSTLALAEADCRLHFRPQLGARPLTSVTPLVAHKWLTTLAAQGLAPLTQRRLFRELHAALACGVRMRLISHNPLAEVRPPRVPRTDAAFLDPNAARRLLTAAAGGRLEALLYLALESGARKGELLALRWSDVDLDRGEMRIRRSAREFAGRGVEFLTPKTYRSARAVSLSPSAVEMLRRHAASIATDRRRAGAGWCEHDLVFPSRVGTPLRAGNLRRAFLAVAARAGLPGLRFHTLRHTSASLMAGAGVPVVTISAQLGHARPSITQDLYTHVLPQQQEAAARAAAEALSGVGDHPHH